MRILLVNDDGVFAPGIRALAAVLKEKHSVTISAPATEKSGFSQSLTYMSPIRTQKVEVPGLEEVTACAVHGTPADCAKFGIRAIMGHKVDLVISGINNGLNLGTDIYYSGTIGGATEATMFGVPAIAVSQRHTKDMEYTYAAEYVAEFIENVDINQLPPRALININFPGDPESGIAGVRLTRQGVLEYNERYELISEDSDGAVYRLIGDLKDASEEDTDFYAVQHRFISITPLRYDRTDMGCAHMFGGVLK